MLGADCPKFLGLRAASAQAGDPGTAEQRGEGLRSTLVRSQPTLGLASPMKRPGVRIARLVRDEQRDAAEARPISDESRACTDLGHRALQLDELATGRSGTRSQSAQIEEDLPLFTERLQLRKQIFDELPNDVLVDVAAEAHLKAVRRNELDEERLLRHDS